MAAQRALIGIAVLAAIVSCATGQPFTVNATFQQDVTMPAARSSMGYDGFTFDFAKAKAVKTPGGTSTSNQGPQNPFLQTLTGQGLGQTALKLGPCSINPVHIHPRGDEITYVVSGGPIEVGIVEENAGMNQAVLRNISAGQSVTFPQGLLHWQYNNNCEPVQLISTLSDKDPGTATTWASLMAVPNDVLSASTGIHEQTWERLRSLGLLVTPMTGGTACLRRCGLAFEEVNTFVGVKPPNPIRRRGAVVGTAFGKP